MSEDEITIHNSGAAYFPKDVRKELGTELRIITRPGVAILYSRNKIPSEVKEEELNNLIEEFKQRTVWKESNREEKDG